MNQRLKILQLTGSLSIGGAERLILSLAEHIDPKDFEIHICAFGNFGKETYLKDFQALDCSLYTIQTNRFYDPRTLILIARYIRKHQIHLIHTHLIYADIIGSIVGYLLNIPVVTTLHNEPNSYKKRRLDRRWLAKITAKRFATHLVTVSNYIRDLFLGYWEVPDDRISCIYNGVELTEFLNIPEQTENDKIEKSFTVVNIASLTTQKAQHILLGAAKIVLSELPETRFLIVGTGDLENELKAETKLLGLTENVEFTGIRRDIPDLLSQAHIFVLSSLWEGLPLAAIEAMAAARGIVSTDVGGIRELIEPNLHGLVVPPNDIHALADALLLMLKDDSMRISMAKLARERVCEIFSIESTAKHYQEIYQSLIKTRRKI